MQFRNFIWPNEPSSLRVTSRRRTALLEEPGGGWTQTEMNEGFIPSGKLPMRAFERSRLFWHRAARAR